MRIFKRLFVMKGVTAREASSISGACAVTPLAPKQGMIRDEGTTLRYHQAAGAPKVRVRLRFHLGVDFASKVNKPRCSRR